MYDQYQEEDIGTTLNKLEASITNAKKDVALMDMLEQLERHPAFIALISEGYLKDLAVRLVLFKGSLECNGLTEEDTNKEILAIGKFSAYLSSVRHNGMRAQSHIEACVAEIAAIQTGGN